MSYRISKLALAAVSACALLLPACAASSDNDGAKAGTETEGASSETTSSELSIPLFKPEADAWYTPPAGFEANVPGTVLRSREVSVLALPLPVKSIQLLTRSTDAKGNPVAVASTLMVPQGFYLGKRPLLSYQTAINSLGFQCNPSYSLRIGIEIETPFIVSALLKGWAVVVTDHQGPRNAWGASKMAGHAVLDGIRGAESLPNTGLAGVNTPVGMWGYSGGAFATAAAVEMHPSYAPELKVKGAALGGAPHDPKKVALHGDGGILSGLYLGSILGLMREYPELLPLLNAQGQAKAAEMGEQCTVGHLLALPFAKLDDLTDVSDPWNDPLLNSVLAENTGGQAAPTAPVYQYHSVIDEVVPFSEGQDLRKAWCARGAKVQFDATILGEHALAFVSGAPGALGYLEQRFIGLFPAPSNCGR